MAINGISTQQVSGISPNAGVSANGGASIESVSNAISAAANKGITGGIGNGLFGSDNNCTRAQIVTFLYRANGQTVDSGNVFTDVPADAYYADAVNWAVAEGITGGTTATTFAPNATCTRAQVVTFLYRDMAQ